MAPTLSTEVRQPVEPPDSPSRRRARARMAAGKAGAVRPGAEATQRGIAQVNSHRASGRPDGPGACPLQRLAAPAREGAAPPGAAAHDRRRRARTLSVERAGPRRRRKRGRGEVCSGNDRSPGPDRLRSPGGRWSVRVQRRTAEGRRYAAADPCGKASMRAGPQRAAIARRAAGVASRGTPTRHEGADRSDSCP